MDIDDWIENDEIDFDVLNGKKFPTDEHLAEQRRRWEEFKKSLVHSH